MSEALDRYDAALVAYRAAADRISPRVLASPAPDFPALPSEVIEQLDVDELRGYVDYLDAREACNAALRDVFSSVSERLADMAGKLASDAH